MGEGNILEVIAALAQAKMKEMEVSPFPPPFSVVQQWVKATSRSSLKKEASSLPHLLKVLPADTL